METLGDIAAIIRDIMISVYLIAGVVLTLMLLVFSFFIYKAVRGLLKSARYATDNVGKVSDAAVEHIAKPLEEGVSVGSVAGNTLGFVTGFVTGFRGRKEEKRKRRIPFL